MEHCCELISEHLQRSGHHLLSKDDADGVAWTLGLAAIETQTDTADDRSKYRKQVDQTRKPIHPIQPILKQTPTASTEGDTGKSGEGSKSSKGDTEKGGTPKGGTPKGGLDTVGKGDADRGSNNKRRYDEAFSIMTDTLAQVQQTLQEVAVHMPDRPGSSAHPIGAQEPFAEQWPTRSITFGPSEIGKFRMIADSITRAKRSTINCKQMLNSMATQIDHELEVLTAAEEHLKSIIMGW